MNTQQKSCLRDIEFVLSWGHTPDRIRREFAGILRSRRNWDRHRKAKIQTAPILREMIRARSEIKKPIGVLV